MPDSVARRDPHGGLTGDRLGSGVVVDGNLLRGTHGGVGEMVAFDHVEGVGDAGGLGFHAWELAHELITAGKTDPSGELGTIALEALDGRTVLELAERGDPDGVRIADQVGHRLARVVSILGSMHDPNASSSAAPSAHASTGSSHPRALRSPMTSTCQRPTSTDPGSAQTSSSPAPSSAPSNSPAHTRSTSAFRKPGERGSAHRADQPGERPANPAAATAID